MTKAYIGVDPGKTGAAALLTTIGVFDVYDFTGERSANLKLTEWFSNYRIEAVAIEDVFKLGHKRGWLSSEVLLHNMGFWTGLFVARGYQPHLVRPQSWQRLVPPVPQHSKVADRAVEWIQKLIPGTDAVFTLKRHRDRAAALFVALWLKERGESGLLVFE